MRSNRQRVYHYKTWSAGPRTWCYAVRSIPGSTLVVAAGQGYSSKPKAREAAIDKVEELKRKDKAKWVEV